MAYNYGVSGPFWYASGATVQVLLFATLAIELKRKSPNAHTFLEIIKARYGVATHAVYITFGLVTNILVTAMLLTGGSAVVSDLTGVPTAAACFLLPIGVVLYTMFGGIKATFLTDYVHTVMIFSQCLHSIVLPPVLTSFSHHLRLRIHRVCHERGSRIAQEGVRALGQGRRAPSSPRECRWQLLDHAKQRGCHLFRDQPSRELWHSVPGQWVSSSFQ